jgi:hypothetical protein
MSKDAPPVLAPGYLPTYGAFTKDFGTLPLLTLFSCNSFV